MPVGHHFLKCHVGITFEMPSWHHFKKNHFDTGFKTYFKTGFNTGNTPGTGFNTGNTPEIPFYAHWASPLHLQCSFPARKRLRGVLNLLKAERAAGELS